MKEAPHPARKNLSRNSIGIHSRSTANRRIWSQAVLTKRGGRKKMMSGRVWFLTSTVSSGVGPRTCDHNQTPQPPPPTKEKKKQEHPSKKKKKKKKTPQNQQQKTPGVLHTYARLSPDRSGILNAKWTRIWRIRETRQARPEKTQTSASELDAE